MWRVLKARWASVMACLALGAACAQQAAMAQPVRPAPMEAYAALPAAKGARLSPDGKRLALIESHKGRYVFVVREIDGKRPPVAVDPGIGEPLWIQWKSNKRLLASVRWVSDSGAILKVSDTRLISFDADGSHLVKLVRGETGDLNPQIQDHVLSFLPDDPDHVLLELPRIERIYNQTASPSVVHQRYEHPEAQRVNLHTGATETVVPQHGVINHWMADPQGRVRLGWSIQTREKTLKLLVKDAPDAAWRLVHTLPLNTGQAFEPLAHVEGSPTRLYVLSNHEKGLDAIHEFDLGTGAFVRVVAQDASQDIVPTVRGGRLVAFARSSARVPTYLDPQWAQEAALLARALPNAWVNLVDRSEDGQRVLVRSAKGDEPEDFWLLQRGAGETEIKPITDSQPGLEPELIAQGRWVRYKARDGLTISARLTLPVGSKAGQGLPFVVLPHGGPSSHDHDGFDHWVQFLASRGYGVLQPQFRGSTSYGQAFLTAGYQQWGLAMQDDVTDATRWLVEQRLADPKRMVLLGKGYGGYAALMGLVKEPGLYQGAIAFAPVTDLPALIDDRYRYLFGDLNLPQIGTDSRQLEQTSPAWQAKRVDKPVLLVHGKQDTTVPVRHTEVMEAALKKLDKPVEAIYLPQADHHLQREADRLTFLKALDAFLARVLK
jgi:dipeptidyl aminopeptidase/acylaminoacyl peptidase